MCVKVANHNCVIREVKKSRKVRRIVVRTGAMRREIEIDDISGSTIDAHPDTINLHSPVLKVGDVKVGEREGMMDKEGYTSAILTAWAVFPDEGIASGFFRIGG